MKKMFPLCFVLGVFISGCAAQSKSVEQQCWEEIKDVVMMSSNAPRISVYEPVECE